MVAVCKGFTVMAIGKVLTEPVSITDPKYGHLKKSVENSNIDYEDWNKTETVSPSAVVTVNPVRRKGLAPDAGFLVTA